MKTQLTLLVALTPAIATAQSTRTTTLLPQPILVSAVATDPVGGTVVGVADGGAGTLSTFTWDGAAWNQIPATGPTTRAFSAMSDAPNGEVILFDGGLGVADTWTFDGATWTDLTPSLAIAPPPRSGAAIARFPGGNVILFGGATPAGSALGDTWEWDGVAWNPLMIAGPAARFGAAMAPDDQGNLILFGGSPGGTTFFADTWRFDGAAWTQQTTASAPSGRFFAAMELDPQPDLGSGVRSEIILGGGFGASGPVTDVWLFAAGNWTPQPTLSVPAQAANLMTSAYDAQHREIVMVDDASRVHVYGLSGFTMFGVSQVAASCVCGGTGSPLLLGRRSGAPNPGNTIVYQGKGALPGSTIFIVFGPSTPGIVAPFPLPFGCPQFVDPIAGSITTPVNLGGQFSFGLVVPASLDMVGVTLTHQAVSLTAPALCASNGIETRIGR